MVSGTELTRYYGDIPLTTKERVRDLCVREFLIKRILEVEFFWEVF